MLVLALALVAIIGTLPVRKSLAISFEYVFDIWFDRHETRAHESPENEPHRADAEHQ